MISSTGLLLGAVALLTGAVDERPNIVLVMLDDLGWMDLGCQGNPSVDTPHLDRLAGEGMRFTDAYAPAPVCSPTRAAVLTGLSPARLHITNHIPDQKRFLPDDPELLPARCRDRLPAEHVTVAEHLKKAGYRTAFFGKWHLAGASGKQGLGDLDSYPEAQGFDRNVGGCALGGPPTFFDPYRIHNLPPRREGEYLPDRLADEAIEFLEQQPQGQPFFLTWWPYAVHWPMEAPAELVEKYESLIGPGVKDARYAAMTEAVDAAIGKVLGAINSQGLGARTLVIVTSDNGPFLGVADAQPLRSGKGYLYEGGIRVPLLVRWPGVVASGSVCEEPVVLTDLCPTLLEAAGLEVPEGACLDGESLVDLLGGGAAPDREALFFHYPNYAWHRSNRLGGAVRAGQYKLIEYYADGTRELYDLDTDLGESTNLVEEMPEKVAELSLMLYRWLKETQAAMPVRPAGKRP